jgi:hypothetical protein
MKPETKLKAHLLRICAALCFATCAASAAPVLYTFTATTRATPGSPSHLEKFELTTADFLPVVVNGPVISFLQTDPALLSCVACATPPAGALHFLRADSSDVVQFRDADGILRPYFFAPNTLSIPGTHDTLPGFNVNVGNIVVAETPEPSTAGLVITGLAAAALRLRRYRVRC